MKAFFLLTLGALAVGALAGCGAKSTANDGSAPVAASETGGANNTVLTAAEKADGWQLLFNGSNFDGWHNFHSISIQPGWQVKDGLLVCADPEHAGDIVTTNLYSWF